MKRILILALAVMTFGGAVSAQAPVTYPSAQPWNVFEFLLNRAIDSPPYTKGHSYTSTSGTSATLIFSTAESKVGYYCWTYVMTPVGNTGDITIIKQLNSVTLETITLKAGAATVADFVACDVLIISKVVAADVVYYGGFYNR